MKKKIILCVLAVVLVFSFCTVALAEGNGDGNENGNPPQETQDGDGSQDGSRPRDQLRRAFREAIKNELQELKSLRQQMRETHQENVQLQQQIKAKREELKGIEGLEISEDTKEAIHNAVNALKIEAQQHRQLANLYKGKWQDWRESRDTLDIESALGAIQALKVAAGQIIESQTELGDALSVLLAHLESIEY